MLRLVYRAPALLYRWHYGWLLGHRFLLLIHVGRRTGRLRHTVLEVVEYRQATSEAIVLSAYGPHTEWLRNIDATGRVDVVIGAQRFVATHRRIDVDEAASVLTGYLRRNRFAAPIIRAVLGRFLGWRFDGSNEHCRRVAAQLPFIAFRPRP
jgi:deazaflavin-dependent oxidoreductase (nitroreductase family)